MYHSWLDRWDERRAKRGDAIKTQSDFALDTELAFPSSGYLAGIEAFCKLAEKAVEDPTYFDEPSINDLVVEREGEWIRFPSGISTDVAKNNVGWAKITESGSFDQALVVFHHWNASARYHQIANFFSRRGITVVEMALPYHFERSRSGADYADYMLSPSIGRTMQSMRQAVWDGRKLIRWLKGQGYKKTSVLGMSLGSWVAGLIAANDTTVSKAALFLTAGSLADMVWTGRATQTIPSSLQPTIELSDLRRAWAPLNLVNHAHRLARDNLELHVVLAKRDKVVLPELSKGLIQGLKNAGAQPSLLELNCGHYSLSMPPYIIWAGLSVARLLKHSP
ncbi:MAG TPA: dienelactone hydrolase-related enzyme [Sulfitobacter sp.]|uniref:alpha/beta hydrolase family protein n=1 Tax=Sulfitobacter dubius TaxID=218673 RepID=UPI000E80A012|nr:dienelactone hydrolase-related enzyme [Sulfitobacter sp.]